MLVFRSYDCVFNDIISFANVTIGADAGVKTCSFFSVLNFSSDCIVHIKSSVTRPINTNGYFFIFQVPELFPLLRAWNGLQKCYSMNRLHQSSTYPGLSSGK